MKKMFFGGRFLFMYKDYTIEKLSDDYRAKLLGDVKMMLKPPSNTSRSVRFSNTSEYIGPFYFYEEGTSASAIVKNEYNMVEKCTDAVFLLDNRACPGTISELIHASFLRKIIHIFYVTLSVDDDEPENEISSRQWYAIQMSSMINGGNTHIKECATYDEAVELIINKFK